MIEEKSCGAMGKPARPEPLHRAIRTRKPLWIIDSANAPFRKAFPLRETRTSQMSPKSPGESIVMQNIDRDVQKIKALGGGKVRFITLYGSASVDRMKEDSDIDLCVYYDDMMLPNSASKSYQISLMMSMISKAQGPGTAAPGPACPRPRVRASAWRPWVPSRLFQKARSPDNPLFPERFN